MARMTRGRGSLKLLGSMRGRGVLKMGAAACEVGYHLDRYEERLGQTASGEVDGDLTALGEVDDGAGATLVLENGSEIEVTLSQVEPDGADLDARGAILDE